jgi:hypothetical protein
MTAEYRNWLPADALDDRAVERMIADVVDEWSRKWFARRPMQIRGGLRPTPGGNKAVGEAGQWHVLEDGLAVAVLPKGVETISGAMLDVAIDARSASPADWAMIERLSGGCVEDLRNRLVHLLKLAPDARWLGAEAGVPSFLRDSHSCEIGLGAGEPALRIAIGPDLFVTLIKHAVRAAPLPILLRPLGEGLAPRATS